MHRTQIDVRDLTVRFAARTAVDGASFATAGGEIFGLLGPSGCGKSTTLKVVAGLIAADSGEVLFDGQSMTGVAPHRRNVGMVFQSYALFPHMTVTENLRFGLRMHGVARAEQPGRIARALERVRIAELANTYPDRLSGGQQQRVALARSLVTEPAVLLLDEPLSALDRQLREAMRAELKILLKSIGITTLIVTHDQDEALEMCDRIAVMRNGRIEQIGDPIAMYKRPRNAFVANFLGKANLVGAHIVERKPESIVVALPGGAIAELAGCEDLGASHDVAVVIRPEAIVLSAVPHSSPPAGCVLLTGTVADIAFRGDRTVALLKTRDGSMLVSSAARIDEASICVGSTVAAIVRFGDMTAIDRPA